MPTSRSDEVQDYLYRHVDRHPEDRQKFSVLTKQLRDPIADLFDRKNPTGHVVASSVVLNKEFTHLLLIHHKLLQLWIPPGGHVDPADATLWAAAYREVGEETGLKAVIPILGEAGVPELVDIDSHEIAPNAKKGEGTHFHHDFMFVGIAKSMEELSPQLEEVTGAKWVPWEQAFEAADPRTQRVIERLKKLIPLR